MYYNQKNSKFFCDYPIFDLFFNRFTFYVNVSMVLGLIINILIVASYFRLPGITADSVFEYAFFYDTKYIVVTNLVMNVLISIQLAIAFLILINYLIKDFSKYSYGLSLSSNKKSCGDSETKESGNQCTRKMMCFLTFMFRLFSDVLFYYYLVYLLCAGLAYWNYAFSVFQLFGYMLYSSTLKMIAKALYAPRIQLLNSVILLLIIIYWFSIIVYLYFFDQVPGAIGYSFRVLFFKLIDYAWKVKL